MRGWWVDTVSWGGAYEGRRFEPGTKVTKKGTHVPKSLALSQDDPCREAWAGVLGTGSNIS